LVRALSAIRSQEEALARARRFTERARARCVELGYGFVASYLVGSRARGDYMAHSDIDVVLVLRGVKSLNMLERIYMFKDILEPGLDLRVYDVEEWLDDSSPWIREMRREAVELAHE